MEETIDMEVDMSDLEEANTSSSTNNQPGTSNHSTNQKKKRKPPANVRRENTKNRITRLGTSKINYSDDTILGIGATSIVYKGYFGSEDCPSAIKRVRTEQYDIYKSELKIWRQVGHVTKIDNVNVIRLFYDMEFNEGEDQEGNIKWYYFAMELADCDLAKRIKELSATPDEDYRTLVKSYLLDAASGLKWIHSRRIIHRDIKPENILIFKGEQGCQEIAKLGDFGISRKLSETATGTDSMGKGTANWMAPEVLRALNDGMSLENKRSLDIFSFGMTAYFALSRGRHPFEHGGQIFIPVNILSEYSLPSRLEASSEYSANHLFRWMMRKKPEQRPTIADVLAHPFFWNAKTSLEFLVDVAKTFDKRDTDLNNIRNTLDLLYSEEYRSRNADEFGWRKIIGSPTNELIFQRKDSGKKNYDETRLMKLMELVRDKKIHFQDLPDKLLSSDYFGDDDGQYTFSEKKYARFFMNKFPDVIIFLFSKLIKERCSALGFIHKKYFLKFSSSFPT